MNWVSSHRRHYTQMIRRGLIAIVVCALSGCWQEVQYTPPASTPARTTEADRPATEPPAGSGEVGGFADDVATSLAPAEESKVTGENPPVEEKPAAPSAVDDLFAEPGRVPESGPPSVIVKSEPVVSEPRSELPAVAPAREGAAKPQAGRNTRRMAWLLGSKLSLAALANEHGAPADEVAKWFDQSQTLAKMLGTSAAALPTPAKAGNEAAPSNQPDQALGYLFTQGQQIGQDLARKYGVEQAALFELAVKSNILLALYKPGEVVVDMLSAAIRQAGERAKLPVELYQPLLDALAQTAPAVEVRDLVFKLHADVDRYLSQSDGRDSFSSREPMQ